MPAVMQRVLKPTTRRGKKVLINRGPKLIENVRQTLFMKGKNTSDIARNCLKDLYQLKKPEVVQLNKKNDVLPFEDVTPIEKLSKKYDASLFAFISHNKKRPNNLILGRMFDNQLLDMVELGIGNFKSLSAFTNDKIAAGIKPCLLFAGPQFSQVPNLNRIQNLFIDFFQREKVEAVRLQGLEHVIMFTVDDNGENIFMRSYKILLKKSGERIPRVELEEIGPSVDFKLRRLKLASDDHFKRTCKQPKQLKARKIKNVSHNVFGTKVGRIHMTKQDINKLQTRKMKGLKKSIKEKKEQRLKKVKAKAQ
ncbi:ribosome production factor 2-like protein Non3 [Lycorma delicatula]|uniref:ribosome production factor 2-like protein Non3 n=1 Tax=Lycorma delicatula TaxID=130591 RepID=UPI003F51892E